MLCIFASNPGNVFCFSATHVTMSVTKLLSRVVSPNSADLGLETDLHEYTYGITSDPLAQFAVALAALIQ